jgi:WD40 repeat protein
MASGAPILGHLSIVESVAFSPDGKRIVSGSVDPTIRIWDMDTGMAIGAPQAVQEHTGPVYSVAISPDGTRFVSGSDKSV